MLVSGAGLQVVSDRRLLSMFALIYFVYRVSVLKLDRVETKHVRLLFAGAAAVLHVP